MARKPMVTRTIKKTEAVVMCLDVKSAEPFNKTFVLTRQYKDKEHILKALANEHNTEDVKLVSVVDIQTTEALYGMDEATFIEHAEILPDREKRQSKTKHNQQKL